jgi:PAS domain S-box-containing protein
MGDAVNRLGKNAARWIDLGVMISTVMLLLTLGIGALGTARVYRAANEIARTHQLIEGLEQTLSLAQGMETGQRGYIITGKQEYLQPYLRAVPRIDPQVNAVQSLLDDDAERQRLVALRSLLVKKQAELASSIDLRRTKGFDAAQAAVANGEGKLFMDRARKIVDEMELTAQRRLDALIRDARNIRDLAIVLGLLSGLLTLGISLSFAYMMRRLLGAERRAADRLVEQRELLRVTLSGIGDGVIAVDAGGRISLFNRVAEQMTGWTSDEASGRSIDDILSFRQPGPDGQVLNPVFFALAERRVANLPDPVRLVGRHRKINVEGNGAPMIDASGRLVGAVLVIRDVSERTRSEERFRLAVEAAPNAMIMTDREGRIVLVNSKAEELFGYAREEMHGAPIEILVPERFRHSHPNSRAAFYGAMKNRAMGAGRDLYGLRRDGSEFPVEIGLNPIETAQGVFVLSAIVDVTERRRAEEVLRQRSEALARSNEDLEQFAYVASHDLQEPLRAVAGPLQLLQRRYQGQLDSRAEEFIKHAVDGATRMQSIIDDLLDYSRVGRHEDSLDSVDCEQVLNRALKNLGIAIQESGAEISNDKLPTVRGAGTQLDLLFQNLIGNAIKFRSKDRPLHVHIGVQSQGHAWMFRVVDNGIGIEPEYFDRIFLIFQRLHTRREYPGTGIGLAMCKRIVERHGGSIGLESEPGKGTTFFFTLPK